RSPSPGGGRRGTPRRRERKNRSAPESYETRPWVSLRESRSTVKGHRRSASGKATAVPKSHAAGLPGEVVVRKIDWNRTSADRWVARGPRAQALRLRGSPRQDEEDWACGRKPARRSGSLRPRAPDRFGGEAPR